MKLGYARVSTPDQSFALQVDALRHAGKEFREVKRQAEKEFLETKRFPMKESQ